MWHEVLVPGADYDTLDNYKDDAEGEVEDYDADGKEIFGQDRELVKNIKEGENNKEQEIFSEENNPEDLEGVPKEQENDEAEQMIDDLIEAFEEEVLPEDKQLLEEVNNEENKESDEPR